MAFVVRIDREEEKPDYKVFRARADAERRFWLAAGASSERDFSGVALYQTVADDVRQAVDAVKSGDKAGATLLEIHPYPVVDLESLGL